MFTLLRNINETRRATRLARLIALAKQADEVLMGCNLEPDTRHLLQAQRDKLEGQIRELQTA